MYYVVIKNALTTTRIFGIAKIVEITHTNRIDLLQLLIVHRDRAFIGKTITINL